eukprot:GILI01012821.1.p1 GENE.GILI01012821.1~~GILI01012821.1.p1  ORF type:complete len:474 (+),score=83.24 GILI01012821.1:185-1423(+)
MDEEFEHPPPEPVKNNTLSSSELEAALQSLAAKMQTGNGTSALGLFLPQNADHEKEEKKEETPPPPPMYPQMLFDPAQMEAQLRLKHLQEENLKKLEEAEREQERREKEVQRRELELREKQEQCRQEELEMMKKNNNQLERNVQSQLQALNEKLDQALDANRALSGKIRDLEKKQFETEMKGKSALQILHAGEGHDDGSPPAPSAGSACFNKKSCFDCLKSPQCGWCSLERRCVVGNQMGPLDGSCVFYDYGICSESPCARYDHCESCLRDPHCGWCEAERSCADGSKTQPSAGTCGFGWLHKDSNSPCFPTIGNMMMSVVQGDKSNPSAASSGTTMSVHFDHVASSLIAGTGSTGATGATGGSGGHSDHDSSSSDDHHGEFDHHHDDYDHRHDDHEVHSIVLSDLHNSTSL